MCGTCLVATESSRHEWEWQGRVNACLRSTPKAFGVVVGSLPTTAQAAVMRPRAANLRRAFRQAVEKDRFATTNPTCGRLAACARQSSSAPATDGGRGARGPVGTALGVTVGLGVAVAVGVAVIATPSNALPQWSASTRWGLICFNSGAHNRPAVVPHHRTLPIITRH